MKLEIELDLNKIDYDSINKQIQEKIEELNISEIYNINNKIESILNKKINEAYSEYIDAYSYDSTTYTGTRIINDIYKEKFTEVATKIIEDIFKEDEVQKIILELFPRLFAQAMYDLIKDNISKS